MKDFNLQFYLADSEYLTALRLVTGAVCSAHDIDLDTLEDFKVCVTESAIILKNCGFERAEICFSGGNGVCCKLSGKGGSPCEGENELSLALISALVGECDIVRKGEIIEEVILRI